MLFAANKIYGDSNDGEFVDGRLDTVYRHFDHRIILISIFLMILLISIPVFLFLIGLLMSVVLDIAYLRSKNRLNEDRVKVLTGVNCTCFVFIMELQHFWEKILMMALCVTANVTVTASSAALMDTSIFDKSRMTVGDFKRGSTAYKAEFHGGNEVVKDVLIYIYMYTCTCIRHTIWYFLIIRTHPWFIAA